MMWRLDQKLRVLLHKRFVFAFGTRFALLVSDNKKSSYIGVCYITF